MAACRLPLPPSQFRGFFSPFFSPSFSPYGFGSGATAGGGEREYYARFPRASVPFFPFPSEFKRFSFPSSFFFPPVIALLSGDFRDSGNSSILPGVYLPPPSLFCRKGDEKQMRVSRCSASGFRPFFFSSPRLS